MRDLSEAPADFVSYVDGRLPALESAAHRLSGDELQAERLSQDLLALVALRWRRLSRADTKAGLDAGESADLYLTRLFRQEAFDQGAPQVPLRLEVPVPRRRMKAGRLNLADEAGLIWERARRTMRRRLLFAGGAASVLAVLAICQRGRGSQNSGSSGPDDIRPTALPSGAEQAPASPGPAINLRGVPADIAVPPGDLPFITASPVRRALVLMAANRSDASPIVVLGDDGQWRRVNVAPALAALFMHTAALSPDGLRVAFGTDSGTTVVDLTTGEARDYLATPDPTRQVWLSPRHLLVTAKSLLDVVTGKSTPFVSAPGHVVMPQHFDPASDPASRVIELLSVGEPTTAAARVRRWTKDGTELVTQVNGPLADLIGPWRGDGFSYGGEDGLLARVCMTTTAVSVGTASAVVAIVRAKTARVEKALLVDSAQSGGVRLLGWVDDKHVLLTLVMTGSQQVVIWDLAAGGLSLVSTVHTDGIMSFPDLTSVA